MAILRRDDGVQFVLQAYRELLDLKNKALLKKELRHLSENHGAYARVFRKNGNYEAVFSRDSGFLLGEAIWQHLNQPNDLLYCEALPDQEQVLLVIVRDGVVHLDTVIDYANLAEELAFLLAEKANFAVYIYGDVPLSEHAEDGKFHLNTTQIKSFTRLQAPLYPTVIVPPALRLLPIERAIAELKLDQNMQIALAIAAFIIIVGVIFWRIQTAPVVTTEDNVNPLQSYQAALITPAPAAQLNLLAVQIMQAYSVPGWQPTKVSFDNGAAEFELHTFGSPLTELLQWAQANQLQVKLTSDGALLTLQKTLPARVAPASIVDTQPVLATVIDNIKAVLPGNNIKIGNAKPYGIYQETALTINLTNVSPQVLSLIGNALGHLPIVLGKGTLSLNNGLLSGTIQLSVLGN